MTLLFPGEVINEKPSQKNVTAESLSHNILAGLWTVKIKRGWGSGTSVAAPWCDDDPLPQAP